MKQPQYYKLVTFEILEDGAFFERSIVSLKDPSQISLPSADELLADRLRRGWKLVENQGFGYWSMRRFERR